MPVCIHMCIHVLCKYALKLTNIFYWTFSELRFCMQKRLRSNGLLGKYTGITWCRKHTQLYMYVCIYTSCVDSTSAQICRVQILKAVTTVCSMPVHWENDEKKLYEKHFIVFIYSFSTH